ncbi:hypothetical protein [Streptomyces sp. NPDC051561]|uniref:hypothetical protein n=1 Tax=Streptomyces sp. NPDC051561 TaxID=3365658 RepID=UPI0037B03E62
MTDQLARHRDAMRRHRRSARLLMAGALVLGGFAVLWACLALWFVFVFAIGTSLLLAHLSDSAHYDYRAAAVRADRIERTQRHIPSQRGASHEFVPCCGTWVASAGLAHERHCPYGQDAAA